MTAPTSTVLLLITVLCVLPENSTNADEARRSAKITDKAGTESQITDLSYSGQLRQFDGPGQAIGVTTKQCAIAIPLDDLISIKRTDSEKEPFEITYQWLGKEQKARGDLFHGEFSGKSDFGDIKVATSSLKAVEFSGPPSAKPDREKKEMDRRLAARKAAISLDDGSQLKLVDLRRHASYYSTAGYIIGGTTVYAHYADFRFKRGESLVTVPFEKIQKVEFNANNAVSVTLITGSSASGNLSNEKEAGVEGFTGLTALGNVYIAPTRVKSIVFSAGRTPSE